MRNIFVRLAINSSTVDKQLSARLIAKVVSYRKTINAWKCHLLRGSNQDLCRQELLENLDDNSVYIYMDWAMKWLPEKYREDQSEFFGKRGLSWHISVIVRKNTQWTSVNDQSESENKFVEDDNGHLHLIIVHVFDHCVQDSKAVVSILHDVLMRVKHVDGNIKNAYVRSGNAGCYHSAQTILSLPQISYESMIHVCRIDFCDSQCGKGPCDRYAAVIKSHARCFINEERNVTTANEFVEATYASNGIRGVFAYETRLNKDSSNFSPQFPKIRRVFSARNSSEH